MLLYHIGSRKPKRLTEQKPLVKPECCEQIYFLSYRRDNNRDDGAGCSWKIGEKNKGWGPPRPRDGIRFKVVTAEKVYRSRDRSEP